MRLVLATTGFSHPGGSEGYLLVVGEQLERLGHDVTVRAQKLGAVAEEAARRGIRVAGSDDELPDTCDVVLVQDAPSAYELADRWPRTPQVLRACSDVYDFQLPPALPGVVACVVAVSERVAARVRAVDTVPELIRLRHPIDVRRFSPLSRIGERPRRALLLGNYLGGERLEALTAAWEAAGVECVRAGRSTEPTLQPELAMNRADVVVGKARVILEAMACGRAAYVYDIAGRDGWVTPERYPAMEADNFAGQATGADIDPGRLAADLDAYDARMGDVNRDLAVRHHDARAHAMQLIELFRRLTPDADPTATPALELARLGRRQWASEADALVVRGELRRRDDEIRAAQSELAALHAERDVLRDDLDAWAARAQTAEVEAAHQRDERDAWTGRAHAAEAEADRLRCELATRRARFGIAAGRAADRLRGRA
jgi:hypothetical protein